MKLKDAKPLLAISTRQKYDVDFAFSVRDHPVFYFVKCFDDLIQGARNAISRGSIIATIAW